MTGLLILLISLNLVLFVGVLIWLFRGPARSGSLRLRAMAWAVAGVVFVLATGAMLRLVLQMGRAGAISDGAVDWVLRYWDPVQSVLALTAGLVALAALWRYSWSFVRSDRFVTVLADRASDLSHLEAGDLSARELDVINLIAGGVIGDEEIAADLSISPSTAATHVRNILRKSGLGDRRDLMLLKPDRPPK